jgi:hypothetical protein
VTLSFIELPWGSFRKVVLTAYGNGYHAVFTAYGNGRLLILVKNSGYKTLQPFLDKMAEILQ